MDTKVDGVADGTRTHDNRNHNPGLYQLSYSHQWFAARAGRPARNSILACPTGLEPITPSLEGWCSIRLSYGQGGAGTSRCTEVPAGHAGRGERIRTSDILLPKQARYQAALHPGNGLI